MTKDQGPFVKKLAKMNHTLGQISSVLFAGIAIAIPERSIEFLLFAILFHLWGQDR